MVDVPRHLGVNESLDAAVESLVAAYDNFRINQTFESSPLCLRKYSKALQSLSNCLTRPETACAPETLTAIMIVMIFEVNE